MEEPSSSPSAAEHLESDRAPHDQEVAQRRAAVRAAADQEASEILLAARREIGRVLVRTRHELVTLTAQVRAAGCDTAPDQSDQSSDADDFQRSAAREVRTVLRDARADLLKLSSDAANRWPDGEEARLLASLPCRLGYCLTAHLIRPRPYETAFKLERRNESRPYPTQRFAP